MAVGEKQPIPKTLEEVRGTCIMIHLLHGDEGINHWYDLYYLNASHQQCGEHCTNTARFLLYIHYHDEVKQIILTCEEHSPEDYIKIYEDKMAG